jgi:hypothetical protein
VSFARKNIVNSYSYKKRGLTTLFFYVNLLGVLDDIVQLVKRRECFDVRNKGTDKNL